MTQLDGSFCSMVIQPPRSYAFYILLSLKHCLHQSKLSYCYSRVQLAKEQFFLVPRSQSYMAHDFHSLANFRPWLNFSSGSAGKEFACSAGDIWDTGLIPGSGRSTGEEMATHFSILAWESLWTVEPGELQSKGLQTVTHDWVAKYTTLTTKEAGKHGLER